MTPAPSYDAIVVGSGPGGSTTAYKLSAQGLRVLVVEQGEAVTTTERKAGDPIGLFMARVFPKDWQKLQSWGCVGGLSKFYGASLYRMRESDFRETALEGGVSPAWPITYGELEPFYVEAEHLFRVHGSSYGDPSEPPRSGPYPYPPLPHHPLLRELVDSLEATGTAVSPIPLGIDYGPGGKCVMCGTCDGYMCQLDAKMDAETAALRPALKSGLVDLVTGAECLRILTDRTGARVTGALIRINGETREVHAGVVVSACGYSGTPSLLRRSRTDAHPEGLGNNGGALGRYLCGHYAGYAVLPMGWKPVGNPHIKTFGIMKYYEPDDAWPYPTGTVQIVGKMPMWEFAPRLVHPIIKALSSRYVSFLYMTDAPPTREARLLFKDDTFVGRIEPPRNPKTFKRLKNLLVSAFRRAGYRLIAPPSCHLSHPAGTARMGDDPSTSVVDRDGMVHGIEGLYVADASVLPSAGAVNTALTIIALALRTASVIGGRSARGRSPAGADELSRGR